VRWLALAFAIENLMTAWLPPSFIAQWLGTGPFAIPLAVVIGVPVYINGLAAVPFVGGLIQLGMCPAAGLAFMLSTTATGFAAMTAVWALVRPSSSKRHRQCEPRREPAELGRHVANGPASQSGVERPHYCDEQRKGDDNSIGAPNEPGDARG
jgi:Predicted permease